MAQAKPKFNKANIFENVDSGRGHTIADGKTPNIPGEHKD